MAKLPGAFEQSQHDALRVIEDTSFWFHHRNRVITHLLRKFPILGTFADVGGGNGCVAASIAKGGNRVVVIEPGAGGCEHARARGLKAYQTTIEESPFGEGSLDAVGAFDVIEHVHAPDVFLGECRKRLIAGGRIFITVPAYQWLWSNADEEAGHVRRYTRHTLRTLVETSGFSVQFDSYFFMACVPALAALRAIPYRLGRRNKAIDRAARDHTPGGITQRVMDRLLAIEFLILTRSCPVPCGTSVVMVAQRR